MDECEHFNIKSFGVFSNSTFPVHNSNDSRASICIEFKIAQTKIILHLPLWFLLLRQFFTSLIKKGRGNGPMKPWQPFRLAEKGANSIPHVREEISQIQLYFYHIIKALLIRRESFLFWLGR